MVKPEKFDHLRLVHHFIVPLRMLGKGVQLQTAALLVFFGVCKVFEKLVNNGFSIT